MKHKGLSALLVSFCLVWISLTVFFAPPARAASPEKVTLTMVTAFPQTAISINYSTRQFKKWVEAWSGGQVNVDFKGGPEIIASTELPKVVQRGMFDICFFCPLYAGGQYQAQQLLNFANPVNQRLVVRDSKIFDIMSKLSRNHEMVYLGAWQSGLPVFPFWAKKPSLDSQGRIESLKGTKIRTGGPFDANLISSLGGTAVAMTPGEIYEALRTKLIDGTILTMNSAMDLRLWELVSHVTRYPFYSFSATGLMNAKAFDRLSPQNQNLIIEVAKEVQIASYNYTVAIAWEGFSSKSAFANIPALDLTDSAKQTLIKTRQDNLAKLAAAEPALSAEITASFKKYYDEEHLPLNAQASMIR